MSTGHTDAFSGGEAHDIRARLRNVEDDAKEAHAHAAAAHARHDVHEATCAARYRNIILLILGLVAANSLAAFPHIAQLFLLLK